MMAGDFMQGVTMMRKWAAVACAAGVMLCIGGVARGVEEPVKPVEKTGQTGPGPVEPDADGLRDLPRAKLEDGVFMQAGVIKITAAEIDKLLMLQLTDEKKHYPKNLPSATRVMQSRIEISQVLLQNAVVRKFAQDNKLSTSKEDLDRYVALVKTGLEHENKTYEQMLADSGQSDAEYRSFWNAKLAIEKFAGEKISDAEVDAFFAKNKDSIPLRSAAHILFQYKLADSAPKTIKRTKDEAKAAAEEALKQVKAGKDFAQLAASSSDEELSKGNGGATDFFSLTGKDAMVDAFGRAAYALQKVGDVSPVVETPYGFHIIKLTGLRDDEIRKDIRRYLAAEMYNDLLRPVLMKAGDDAKFSDVLTAPKGTK